jgi:hypothetical protein
MKIQSEASQFVSLIYLLAVSIGIDVTLRSIQGRGSFPGKRRPGLRLSIQKRTLFDATEDPHFDDPQPQGAR